MILFKMQWRFFIILCVGTSLSVCKNFLFGRSKGGNLGLPGSYDGEYLPPQQWFFQKLDHSSPTDLRIWKQRYFVNDSFFDFNNGPVFLMIGGEGPADPKWMVKGAWIEYAKKFKALCINLEHRYYGESHPTEDLSTKNLQYLSSSQALADIAFFISAVNENYQFNDNVKWVAFGGSYPGSLAAWARLKYPHLVHAAVSSSGPLLAKVNFMEYFQVVVNALREKTGGEECVKAVKTAHGDIVRMIMARPREIERAFKLCEPLVAPDGDDIRNLYTNIAGNFADLVQYNEDNRIGADERFRNVTINSVCAMLTKPDGRQPYLKMAAFNELMLKKSNNTCLDYKYKKMIRELANVTWGGEGARQWMYQTCTEFGFYQTSSAEVEAFGNQFTLDFYIQQCKDVFGKKFNEEFVRMGAAWTNSFYGGLDIAVSRVVFVHGSVDPWHALGLTSTQDNDAPTIYIEGTAHCADMYPASDKDPAALVEARLEIQQYLESWLNGINTNTISGRIGQKRA